MSPLPAAEDTEIRSRLSLVAGTSNQIHSIQEERIIRMMVSEEKRCLSELDQEIDRLNVALADLQKKRETCIERTNRYSVALSPHKYVPPEVLGKIFLHSITNGGPVLPPKKNASPWVLRSVCSRWRAIVVAEHRLWSHLKVGGSPSVLYRMMLMDLIPLLWTTTQTFTTSLTLKTHGRNLDLEGILLPYCHRLSSITLQAHLEEILAILFMPQVTFSTLHTLHLSIIGQRRDVDAPLIPLSTFLKLRNITIVDNSPTNDWGTFFSQISLSQLTHATLLFGMNFTDLESIMQQCDNLLSLGVVSPISDTGSISRNLTIRLPRLRSLSLSVSGYQHDFNILPVLQTPSLKEFTLDNMAQNERYDRTRVVWDQRRFSNLLNRSECSLESLNLGGVSDISFEKLFLELPCLVNLVVSTDNPIPGVIFVMMTQGEVLGRLKRLDCATLSPTHFLRLLKHQYERQTPGDYRGLTFAHVWYNEVNETNEFLEIYDELKRKLDNDGRMLLKQAKRRQAKLLLQI